MKDMGCGKSIIVNVMPEETRIAVVENGELVGLELERPHHSQLVGNIYKGVVQNVLPGMQAAFVDIGRNKNAFLYIGDGKIEKDKFEKEKIDCGKIGGSKICDGKIGDGKISAGKSSNDEMCGGKTGCGKNTGISGGNKQKIHIGQVLPVQITKDEVGSKGPRATLRLAIPGRNVVLMPGAAYIGTSHRIASEEERKRLYDIVTEACPEGMGVIIRTAAMGQSRESIQRDIRYLTGVWQSIKARMGLAKNTGLLYRDVDLVIRIVRDIFNDDVAQMVIDDAAVCRRVRELLQDIDASWADRVQLYEGGKIFAAYGIEEELARLESRYVELRSGGFLVIDKTEAMTVIDVNTGSFVGNLNLAETAFALNQEAAAEIMKQLRLRDIGGIILVDFIDMEKESYNAALLQQMRHLAQLDRVKTNVVDITSLGLVEITRKKSRQNVDNLLHTVCPLCEGSGRVLSPETVAVKICRDIRRIEGKRHVAEGYLVQLAPEAANFLKGSDCFDGVKRELGVTVKIEATREVLPGSYILLQG